MDKISVAFHLREPKSKFETPVTCYITINGSRIAYSTHYRVNPKDWTKKKTEKKSGRWFQSSYYGVRERNQELATMKLVIVDLFNRMLRENGIAPTKEVFKNRLDIELQRVDKPKNVDLFSFIEALLESRKRKMVTEGKRVTGNTILSSLKQTRNLLKSFQSQKGVKVEFDSISIDLYDQLVEYMQEERELGINTIGTHIRNVKTFLNEALEKGLTNNRSHQSKHFKKVSEEAYTIALSTDELDQLHKLDLSGKPSLDQRRDLFIVACCTGLRYFDLTKLSRRQLVVKEGSQHLEVNTHKTGVKVPIPIDPRLRLIMNKYKETETGFPKAVSNQKFNQALKELGKLVESLNSYEMYTITKGGKQVPVKKKRFELLTTHTGRRTFATNWYLSGKVSTRTIMAVTGHSTEKAFFKYIRMTPSDVIREFTDAMKQDEHLRVI